MSWVYYWCCCSCVRAWHGPADLWPQQTGLCLSVLVLSSDTAWWEGGSDGPWGPLWCSLKPPVEVEMLSDRDRSRQMVTPRYESVPPQHHWREDGDDVVLQSWMYSRYIRALRNVSSSLLHRCREELKQFWRQKGDKAVLSGYLKGAEGLVFSLQVDVGMLEGWKQPINSVNMSHGEMGYFTA